MNRFSRLVTVTLPADALWLALGALDRVSGADCGVLPQPVGEETREEYPALLKVAAAQLWLALAETGEWDRREDARFRREREEVAGAPGRPALLKKVIALGVLLEEEGRGPVLVAGVDLAAPGGDATVILEFSADAPAGRIVTLRPAAPSPPAADPGR